MTRRTSSRTAARDARTRLEVLRQFRQIYAAVHRHFRVVERRCGLSGAQAWMLRDLARSPQLGVSELATRLSVHQSTASQLVDKLVRAGHVERTASSVDRRRVRLRITPKGAALVRRLPRPAEGVLPRALAMMSTTGLRSLRGNLARLISHLQTRRSQDAGAPMGDP
jgi:DNA-binding MarR family transcriptional regulator